MKPTSDGKFILSEQELSDMITGVSDYELRRRIYDLICLMNNAKSISECFEVVRQELLNILEGND